MNAGHTRSGGILSDLGLPCGVDGPRACVQNPGCSLLRGDVQ